MRFRGVGSFSLEKLRPLILRGRDLDRLSRRQRWRAAEMSLVLEATIQQGPAATASTEAQAHHGGRDPEARRRQYRAGLSGPGSPVPSDARSARPLETVSSSPTIAAPIDRPVRRSRDRRRGRTSVGCHQSSPRHRARHRSTRGLRRRVRAYPSFARPSNVMALTRGRASGRRVQRRVGRHPRAHQRSAFTKLAKSLRSQNSCIG